MVILIHVCTREFSEKPEKSREVVSFGEREREQRSEVGLFVKKKVKITIERLNRLFCVLSCRRRNKEGKRFVVALERPKRKKRVGRNTLDRNGVNAFESKCCQCGFESGLC
jgi:hypothetical protein